jgi:hypothetical protein
VEDILTIAIALAVGLYSILAGRKKPPATTRPQPSPEEYESYEDLNEYEEERTLPQPAQSSSTEPSVMDVLGKILTGDLDGLATKPKPVPSPIDQEYKDPFGASRRSQNQRAHERKLKIAEEERVERLESMPAETPIRDNLREPQALKQAIILKEVLDRPKSLRRTARIR